MVTLTNIRFFTCLVSVLLTNLLAQGTFGQSLPSNISFERVPIPGTIRSTQVSDIVQDKLGLIWLAGDALYRYDGFKFRQYHELADNKGTLNSHDIHYLLYDSITERLFLATHRFGVVAYDYKTDNLISLPVKDQVPIVNILAQTSDGRIWAGSYNSGLFYLEQDTLKKFSQAGINLHHPSGLISIGSTLYVGETGKITVINKNKVTDEIKLSWQGKELPSTTLPTTLYYAAGEKLWIGTEKHGVLVYDLQKKKSTKYFHPSQPPFFSKITRIRQDREGLVWILTQASGLVVYSPKEDRFIQQMKDPFSSQSISSDNCFSILEDREGIIWIGATGDINKYDRHQLKFKHFYHNPMNKVSLTDNMVRGVFEEDGKLWIGTDGGYVNLIDLKTESIKQLKVKLPGDSTNYIPLYFLKYNQQIILIATSGGLLQYDIKTGIFSPFKPLWSLTKSRIVRQLAYRDNKIYFILNGQLFIHDLQTNQRKEFITAGHEQAISITALHMDNRQRLWVGSRNGVSLLKEERNDFMFIPFPDLPQATTGAIMLVLSIQQVDDKLFVGTFNAGLWEIDISDIDRIPIPKKYFDAEGLPSNTVYASLPDVHGNLWLSTNNGICRFDPNKEQFVSFSISEGLQGEEYNRLAYCQTKKGQMIFGGINGVNIFHPSEISAEKENFIPEIISLSIQDPLSTDLSHTQYIYPKNNLVFKHDQNFINVHFFVPHYKQPKRYALAYKLENFEKEWKAVSNENIVNYFNLQPGTYTFLLKATGINGTENITKLQFTISAPYWRTWWFILLSGCVVAFLVMTITRSYIQKAKNDRHRLEELLKIRTFEIEKSKEDLQVLNQKKDLIFSILSHDLRSPLTTLKGFLGYIIDHADELATEELKRHAISIRNSVTNSLDLIDNTLFWSLSQMGTIQYTPNHFSLNHLIEKLHGLYQLTADKKRIPLSISCEDDIVLYGDENMIYVTLRNLVSNALKFTSEGNPVTIHCKRKEGFAEISVTDKGIGMSQEYLKKIRSMDQPMLKKGTSNEKGTGLGLVLCKQFIALNKGELLITSIEHLGTTFTVTLPLAVHETSETSIQAISELGA